MKANKYLLMLFFLFPMYVCAQQQITGKVTDVRGEPIPGASVVANNDDGQKFNAITNSNGSFSLNIPNEIKQITFSYIGMTPVTETINGRSVLNI